MKETSPQFHLRLPEDLRELIHNSAERKRTSMTSEILQRLHESFVREGMIKDEGLVGSLNTGDPDARELIVAMEILTNQVDLMRKELNARLKSLKGVEENKPPPST